MRRDGLKLGPQHLSSMLDHVLSSLSSSRIMILTSWRIDRLWAI